MRARLLAGVVGILIVIVGSLVFLETRHPQVAATNSVAPYTPAWAIPGGGTRCQLLHKVPAGANRLRMALSSAPEKGIIQAVIYRGGRDKRVAGAQLPSQARQGELQARPSAAGR